MSKADDAPPPSLKGTLTLEHGEALPAGPLPGAPPGYRILRKLGEGGMGEVWLAEQGEPVRREVALKFVKAGRDSGQVLQRFDSERAALALMDHPAIARVYDGGTTPEGRPYFSMEYVAGEPLTEHCDRQRLPIRARLELFLQLCAGVRHAHQKAVIHRDLKPSNALVASVDGRPEVKVIDFGIAKALGPWPLARAGDTLGGSTVGTPEYMSPEQARGRDVDTRADVYSLGVVLCELLSGARPTAPGAARATGGGRGPEAGEEPLPPSALVAAAGDRAGALATARGTEPAALQRALRGDLDAVVLRAVEASPEARYQSVGELAEDLARYLRDEPVGAREAGLAHRLRKYARRHRLGVAFAASAAVALALFVGGLAVQNRRVVAERDRANREREAARRVTQFLTGIFRVADPGESRGNSVTARELLDRASAEAGTALAGDPELQAQMMDVMAGAYVSLGLYPNAHRLLEAALARRREALGPEAPETLTSMRALGAVLRHEGRYAEAVGLLEKTLGLQQRLLGPEHLETARSMYELGSALTSAGQYPRAEPLMREVLERWRRVLGPDHLETADAMNALANVYDADRSHAPEAEALLREALQVKERVLGPDAPDTLQVLSNLAAHTANQRRYEEGEALTRQVIERQTRVLGPDHQLTLFSRQNLATILFRRERLEEADAVEEAVLRVRRHDLGPEHPDTTQSMMILALIRKHQGRYRDADALLRETLAIRRRVLGPRHPATGETLYNLACNLAQDHRPDEAIAALREAVDCDLQASVRADIAGDDDFVSLRGDPRFQALVRSIADSSAPSSGR